MLAPLKAVEGVCQSVQWQGIRRNEETLYDQVSGGVVTSRKPPYLSHTEDK